MRKRRLTSAQVRHLRRLYFQGKCPICGVQKADRTIGALAREFGISRSYCSEVISGKYYWEINEIEHHPHLRSGPRAAS